MSDKLKHRKKNFRYFLLGELGVLLLLALVYFFISASFGILQIMFLSIMTGMGYAFKKGNSKGGTVCYFILSAISIFFGIASFMGQMVSFSFNSTRLFAVIYFMGVILYQACVITGIVLMVRLRKAYAKKKGLHEKLFKVEYR